MLMLQKSLFDPHNDMETLYLRQQVAAIVFHTLVATLVTFFLDLECNKDKVRNYKRNLSAFHSIVVVPVMY